MYERWLTDAGKWVAGLRAKLANLGAPAPMTESAQAPPPRGAPSPEPSETASPAETGTAARHKPRGHIDGIHGDRIGGWVWDALAPDERHLVEIRVQGELVATVLADRFRQDLVKAGIGDGCYGFMHHFETPLDDAGAVDCRVDRMDYWLVVPSRVRAAS